MCSWPVKQEMREESVSDLARADKLSLVVWSRDLPHTGVEGAHGVWSSAEMKRMPSSGIASTMGFVHSATVEVTEAREGQKE
jgi:hypothetical protein